MTLILRSLLLSLYEDGYCWADQCFCAAVNLGLSEDISPKFIEEFGAEINATKIGHSRYVGDGFWKDDIKFAHITYSMIRLEEALSTLDFEGNVKRYIKKARSINI